jgi:glycosyltransferase involved in cell wall biosynthesis
MRILFTSPSYDPYIGGAESAIQDLARELNGCQFLVLPSGAEGCPVTVLEAIAAGKMTIGSRVERTVEVIEPEQNGILFAAGDASELGSLILRYGRSETERLRIEANIKGRSWEQYDIVELVEEHVRLYQAFDC